MNNVGQEACYQSLLSKFRFAFQEKEKQHSKQYFMVSRLYHLKKQPYSFSEIYVSMLQNIFQTQNISEALISFKEALKIPQQSNRPLIQDRWKQ